MKNTLSSIAVLATLLVPFVASWEGGRRIVGDNATRGTSLSIKYLPVLDWDTSDLDARDAQNKPIRNPEAIQNLSALFINNLFSLAVVKDVHAIDEIWNELTLYSHLFKGLIFNIAYAIFGGVSEALAPSSKRFVHNVHNLWIALSVGIFFCSLMCAPAFVKLANTHRILRC